MNENYNEKNITPEESRIVDLLKTIDSDILNRITELLNENKREEIQPLLEHAKAMRGECEQILEHFSGGEKIKYQDHLRTIGIKFEVIEQELKK